MMSTVPTPTELKLPGLQNLYHGKVRDVYSLANDLLVMVASNRISAFDVVLDQTIPHKGQVLNQMANFFLDQTQHLVPNWKITSPHPAVTIGHRAQPFKVEMVIRGYLTGHAWRLYKAGQRKICGLALADGMRENQRFEQPIITPTTKADNGAHDEDISKEEILAQGLVSPEDYEVLENYTQALFMAGQEYAHQRKLILVDTKYEFGKNAKGEIILIDEIHTPDSSRYFYQDSYQAHFEAGQPQEQLSKEFVRQWLINEGFMGKEGQQKPDLPPKFVSEVSQRYQQLYEQITGEKFLAANETNNRLEMQESIIKALNQITA